MNDRVQDLNSREVI